MEVICLEDKAFYALLEQLTDRLSEKFNTPKDRWIDDKLAMKLLNIKSRTTLQALRDEGKIRFSQHQPRVILYDRLSIDEHLEKHAREKFSKP